jgi:hypothetical protein
VLYRLSYMSKVLAILPDGEEQTGILPDSSKKRRSMQQLPRSTVPGRCSAMERKAGIEPA